MRAERSVVGKAAGAVRFDTGRRSDEGFATGVRRRTWMRRIAGSIVAGFKGWRRCYIPVFSRLLVATRAIAFSFAKLPHLGSRRIFPCMRFSRNTSIFL